MITRTIGELYLSSKFLNLILLLLTVIALPGCKQVAIDDSYDNEIDIAWNFSPKNSVARVYFSTMKGTAINGQFVGEGPANIVGGHITHRGLTNGTRYYYVVKYFTAEGVESYSTSEVSGIPGTYIAGRYRTTGQNREIVEDTRTGLQWQRCSVGQTWMIHSQDCRGDGTRYTWFNAARLTAAGGWRAPALDELKTLIYCSNLPLDRIGSTDHCSRDATNDSPVKSPIIYSTAFPNTMSGGLLGQAYWTSTPIANVNFTYFGVDWTRSKDALSYVRLVRRP